MPAYIKIPDVAGEVNEQNHQQWGEVNSVGLPIHRSIQNGAVGVGRSNGETTLVNVVASKTWDSSTPGLAAAVANGKYKDDVLIHLCSTINNQNVTNLELKLKNVILSSYSFSGTGDRAPLALRVGQADPHRLRMDLQEVRREGERGGQLSGHLQHGIGGVVRHSAVRRSAQLGLALGAGPGTCKE
jgi:type VI secretion system secreted protein Hcp